MVHTRLSWIDIDDLKHFIKTTSINLSSKKDGYIFLACCNSMGIGGRKGEIAKIMNGYIYYNDYTNSMDLMLRPVHIFDEIKALNRQNYWKGFNS